MVPKKIIGIYHKGCTDGTTAGAVLLKRFPRARVFPLAHDYDKKDFRHILSLIDKNTTVYTVDCCIGVYAFLKKAGAVISIDHHASMRKEMENLAQKNAKFTYVFRNDRSGASLSWEYLFPKKKVPRVITLVEDIDLWRWKYGNATKYTAAYLYTLSDEPHKLKKYLAGPHTELLEKGKIFSEYDDYRIQSFVKNTDPVFLNIGKFKVPAFNCHIFESELGSLFSKKLNKAVAIFRVKGEKVSVSFRSRDNQNPSAYDLAKICGGGGHRNSSAARIPLKKFLRMIQI